MSKLLTESSTSPVVVEADGTIPVVLITPGKGSSGYYTEDLIKAFCADAWPAGSHSYVNHLKEGEVRDPQKLIGTLTEDAHWDEEKQAAVSRLKPLKHWDEFVREVAPHTGLSISARGDGKMGEIDGEPVYIVESLEPSIQNTIDLVSYAGRGGYIESLLESAVASTHVESSAGAEERKGNQNMALEEQVATLISTVESLVTEITTERNARQVAEAEATGKVADAAKAVEATQAIEAAEIPASVKTSLIESVKTGNYDVKPEIERAMSYMTEARAAVEAQNVALGATGSSSFTESDLTVKGWN